MTASPRGGARRQFVTSNFYKTRRACRGPTFREKDFRERGIFGILRKSILFCIAIIDFRVVSGCQRIHFSRSYEDSIKK